MPLIKDGKFVQDRFLFIPDGQAFPDEGGVMVTFDRFQSECATLLAHHRPGAGGLEARRGAARGVPGGVYRP